MFASGKGGSGGNVTVTGPLTAFGEVRVAAVHPVVQIDAIYGLEDNVETFVDASPGTGTVGTSNSNFICTTGTGVGGYGVIRSTRAVRYRPGQGLVARWTVGFDTPVALSLQAAGPFNSTNGFFIGYNGLSLGVMHRTGGRHEARTVTLSAAATGAETLTLTLNGVGYSIPVTSGTTVHNSNEIADWLEANQTAWRAYQNDATIVIYATAVGALDGAYSASSTGTLAGAIAQDGGGVANTETWVEQADWSKDRLDGGGPSGMVLDPAKGNVFETTIQYLGYGEVDMRIEDPSTGRFFTFHRFQFANSLTTPTMLNPTLKVGWVAASLGSTTDLTVYGGSAMAGIEGLFHPLRRPRAHVYQRASVGATLTSVFAVRVRSVLRGVIQLSEVLPKIMYTSPAGTKACSVSVLLNPTFTGEKNWTYIDEDASIVEYDETGATFSDVGTVIASFVVAGGGTESLDFTSLAEAGVNPLHLEPGDVLSIAAVITAGSGSAVTASLTWLEES